MRIRLISAAVTVALLATQTVAFAATTTKNTTIQALEKKATTDDFTAMMELSYIYYKGTNGVTANKARSIAWMYFAMNSVNRNGDKLSQAEQLNLQNELALVKNKLKKIDMVSPMLEDAYNAQRKSDVNTILNAVYQYAIDNNGYLPAGITTAKQEICISGKKCSGVSLDVLTGAYLVTIPKDPQRTPDSLGTGYVISKDANERVTVAAPQAKKGTTISITR